MKRFFALMFVSVLVVLSVSARTFVLTVGFSYYADGKKTAVAAKNATELATVFRKFTSSVSTLTSKYATREAILSTMSKFCRNATANDDVIFTFSGHGGEGCLCAFDGEINYDDLLATTRNTKARHIFCFIEACFSGSVHSSFGAANPSSRLITFVSSRPSESSIEYMLKGSGAFSRALAKGLIGKGDANADGKITVSELFRYVYSDVVSCTLQKQHPQLIAPKSAMDVVVVSDDKN